MANLKISQLPEFTGNSNDRVWYVIDNSTETDTYKFSGYTSPYRSWGTNIQPTYYTTDVISNNNGYNAIIAGQNHSMAGAFQSLIAGGNNNDITVNSYRTVIIGGDSNQISGDNDTQILGGGSNSINGGYFSTIINGRSNSMTQNYSRDSIIAGGESNTMTASDKALIITSQNSEITNAGKFTSIIGTDNATISSSATNNAVLASKNSDITGSYEFVAMIATSGRTAQVSFATHVENLVLFNYSNLNFTGDTAAAAGGVVLGQLYHDNGALRVRIS